MVSLYAQDAPQIEVNKNAPVLTFDARFVVPEGIVYDYGTITKGSNGQTYFVFTNTGKEPLIIEKASSSCGCTVPVTPTYPILPGAKDSIAVKYDTNRLGMINKTVTVISNASNSPTIMRIKGNVVEKPQTETPEVVQKEEVKKEEAKKEEVKQKEDVKKREDVKQRDVSKQKDENKQKNAEKQ
jgi:hypothetical protein